MGFKVIKPRLPAEAVESFAAQADPAAIITDNGGIEAPVSAPIYPASKPPKKSAPAVESSAGDVAMDQDTEIVFNLRIRRSDHARLQALADKEERSMQFIAKRIFRAGLQDAESETRLSGITLIP